MNGVANGVYGGDLPNQINTPWIDFSEQSTIIGWGSFTTKFIRYKRLSNLIFIQYHIQGTSNSTQTSFTFPFTSLNTSAVLDLGNAGLYVNNGSQQLGRSIVVPNSNIIQFDYWTSIGASTSTWTASGTKRISGQAIFEIQ